MNVRITTTRALSVAGLSAAALTALPTHAHAAQAFDEWAQSFSAHILGGAGYLFNMVGFIGGVCLLIASLVMIYLKNSGKGGGHNISYGAIVSAAFVGVGLLSITIYAGVLTQTIFNQKAAITGAQQKITFDQ